MVEFPEAWLRLHVRGGPGLKRKIDAVIDSGYTGWLSLPPTFIAALGLRRKGIGRGILADGSECVFDVYIAKVMWDGRVRTVRVGEIDTEPLVGMSLLKGHELKMQIRTRGKVTIKQLT